jgi:hypothetical protein
MHKSIKRGASVAALGACLGVLLRLVTASGDYNGFYSLELWVGAGVTAALGAFFTWWIWLFWGAWNGDRTVRRYVPPAIFGLTVLIFLLEQSDLQLAQRFRQDGVSTKGIVTGVFAEEHNRIMYRYVVGSRTYELKGQAPGLARDFVAGDSIRVFYLRGEPTVGLAQYPGATFWSVLFFSLLGSCWLVSGAAIAHYYRGQSRQSPPTIHLERAG